LGAELRSAEQAVETREDDIAAVAKAEEKLAEAQAELAEIKALVKAYEDSIDAREAIEEQLAEEFGIENLVSLADSNEAGTANEGDLYLFSEDTESGIALTNFEADDMLYLGSGFARVDLEAGVDITDARVGSADTLEVFFQQDGANVKLF